MITIGIDIGTLTVKVVILRDDQIVASSIMKMTESGEVVSKAAIEAALSNSGLSFDSVDGIVATGWGKKSCPYKPLTKSDLACVGQAIHILFPSARTIIDIGAESSKVGKLSESGRILSFARNEKCAAGTGIFFNVVSKILEVPLEHLGELALKATEVVKIPRMCAVYAESEVISYVHKGVPRENIIAGIHEAIAARTTGLLHRVGVEEDIILVGGVAKNKGLVEFLERKVKKRIFIPDEPEFIGAMGAAIIAKTRVIAEQMRGAEGDRVSK